MNLLRINFVFMCLLSTMLTCCSCSNEPTYTKPDFQFIGVDKNKVYFADEGEQKSVEIYTNSMDFSVALDQEGQSWVHHSVDKKTLNISVDKNPSDTPRSAYLTVLAGEKEAKIKIQQGVSKVLVGYVIAQSDKMPDVSRLTHLNYAFGQINDSFNGLVILNEERFSRVVKEARVQNPNIKILISVEGVGEVQGGKFHHMTAEPANRSAFIKSCMDIKEKYGLDGFDMDWETPTSDAEEQNFNALMKEFRQVLGVDGLLTLASPCKNDVYFDFKTLNDYIDYVNIMGYDINLPPFHQSSLYPSELSGQSSIVQGVKAHIDNGVDYYKVVVGMPFYGLAKEPLTLYVDYKDIVNLIGNGEYTEKWDDEGCVPYLVNKAGDYVCTYDNPKSLSLKCEYINKNKLRGAMFWHYDADKTDGTLRNTLADGILK